MFPPSIIVGISLCATGIWVLVPLVAALLYFVAT
jgi:hypothetical protein